MIKVMKELKRHEIMRRIEQQDADQQREPSPSLRDEAATRSNSPSVRDEAATRKSRLAEKKVDLKKQSQFAPAQIGVMTLIKGGYGNISASGVEENKANQSQFQVSPVEKGGEKSQALY